MGRSIWTPNRCTEGETFIILSIIFKVSLVWYFFFLLIIIAWNLQGLTIILLFWNRSMVVFSGGSKIRGHFVPLSPPRPTWMQPQKPTRSELFAAYNQLKMAMSKKVSKCTICLIFMNWCILVKNEMAACPSLSTSV